jgi:acyl carrier protein
VTRLSLERIEEAVRRVMIEDLKVNPALLEGASADTPLLGRGVGLDSVEAMGLALGLEREFDIQIPDSDLTVELFESIGALAAYVQRKAEEQGT